MRCIINSIMVSVVKQTRLATLLFLFIISQTKQLENNNKIKPNKINRDKLRKRERERERAFTNALLRLATAGLFIFFSSPFRIVYKYNSYQGWEMQ